MVFNKKALKYAVALVWIGFYLIFFVNPQLDLSGTELVFEIAVVKLVLDSICCYAVWKFSYAVLPICTIFRLKTNRTVAFGQEFFLALAG